MRYIILEEHYRDIITIHEGIPRSHEEQPIGRLKYRTRCKYKCVCSNYHEDREGYVGSWGRLFTHNCTFRVTRHYEDFEDFMADNIELFL